MIILNKNKTLLLNPDGDFYSSMGDNLSNCKTFVSLGYDDDCLCVSFRCEKDLFVNENSYMHDNDTLFKQEVFEIFITKNDSSPYDYLELEINPNNAIFLGEIHNPSGIGGPTKSLVMLDDKLELIKHSVTISDCSWAGFIKIPLNMLTSNCKNVTNSYMINFYRVVLRSKPSILDWYCTPENSEFLCFKSTCALEKPNFHVIDSFTQLLLK